MGEKYKFDYSNIPKEIDIERYRKIIAELGLRK